MGRQYALESKKSLKVDDKEELERINEKLDEFKKNNSDGKVEEDKILNGVFSINSDFITVKDMDKIKKIVEKAQGNGSVFYQDVISFDTEFLVKEKIYIKESDELDINKLKYASKKMMNKMLEVEEMKGGFWFGSIHRNTALCQ